MKQSSNKSLVTSDKEQLQQFQALRVYATKGVQLFEEDSKEISLVSQEAIPIKLRSLLGILAPSLLSKLESKEGNMIYNPQWVMTNLYITKAWSS